MISSSGAPAFRSSSRNSSPCRRESLPDTLRQLLLVRYHRLETRAPGASFGCWPPAGHASTTTCSSPCTPVILRRSTTRRVHAVAAQLVVTSADSYRFRHALLQEAVDGGARARRATSPARALCGGAQPRSVPRVHHRDRRALAGGSGMPDVAFAATLRAVDDARASFAHGNVGTALGAADRSSGRWHEPASRSSGNRERRPSSPLPWRGSTPATRTARPH